MNTLKNRIDSLSESSTVIYSLLELKKSLVLYKEFLFIISKT